MRTKLRHGVLCAAIIIVIADWIGGYNSVKHLEIHYGTLRYTWFVVNSGGGGLEFLYQKPSVPPKPEWLHGQTVPLWAFRRDNTSGADQVEMRYGMLDLMQRPPSFGGGALGFTWYREASPQPDGSPALFPLYSLFIPYWFILCVLVMIEVWPLALYWRRWRGRRSRGFLVEPSKSPEQST